MKKIVTNSEKETFDLGRSLNIRAGDVVLLEGELGAGKTALVRGVCARLGVSPEDVHSPTFAIVNEYAGNVSGNAVGDAVGDAAGYISRDVERDIAGDSGRYIAGDIKVYHIDAYRITAGDWEMGGFDEYICEDSVCLIEWAENIDASISGILDINRSANVSEGAKVMRIRIEGSGEEPRCIFLE